MLSTMTSYFIGSWKREETVCACVWVCCCISTVCAKRGGDCAPQVLLAVADGNKTVIKVELILSSSHCFITWVTEGVQFVKVSEGVNMLCINTSLQGN